MENQLQQLIDLQQEQNALLKRYLWRLRFSLLSLLLMTAATSIGLGLLVYELRKPAQPAPTGMYQTWTGYTPGQLPFPVQQGGPAPTDDLFGPGMPAPR